MVSLSLTTFLVLIACVSHGQASDELARNCSGSTADSVCGGSAHDETSAMQLRRSNHQHSKAALPYVVCPGSQNGPGLEYTDRSLYTETHCSGNMCCPGTTATDNLTFPCPSADPGWNLCQANAPEEVVYTLTVTTCRLQLPGLNTVTRCYNGTVPGPTLFIKPGVILTIHLHNTLQEPNPPPFLVNITSDFNKSFKSQVNYGEDSQRARGLVDTYVTSPIGSPYGHINSTNLHVHGIVVPGHQPADDVLISVFPNRSYKYTFNIPTYHMPGTHWYHPHRHHATGVQVNGGLFGALIVNDTADVIPPEYLEAEELILRMDTIQAKLQEQLARLSSDKLWQTTSNTFVTLVNGQVNPTFGIKAGHWYRLRMVYAAEFRAIRPTLDAFEGQCQLKLIAKDGIYLNVAPRTVKAMWLASGNTADVMISCSCNEGTSCSTTVRSGWDTDTPLPNHGKNWTDTSAYGRAFEGKLFRLEILDDKTGSLPDLPKFEVKRPCYLVDLRKASVMQGNIHNVSLDYVTETASNQQTFEPILSRMYKVDTNDVTEFNMAYFALKFDERVDRFMHDDQDAAATLPMEQVQEWHVSNIDSHPLHIHVQPYQLQALESTTPYRVEPEGYEEWDQVGDWHDTFFSGNSTAKARIRFALRLGGIGKLIVHCHFLNHEDQGLMAYFNVTNSKCVHPDQCAEAIAAKTSEGTCFTNYYTIGKGYKLVN